MLSSSSRSFCVLLFICGFFGSASTEGAEPGLFQGEADIGADLLPASCRHDPVQQSYIVLGGGENMWFTNDTFHIVWRKVSGDVNLAADVGFTGTGGNAHR